VFFNKLNSIKVKKRLLLFDFYCRAFALIIIVSTTVCCLSDSFTPMLVGKKWGSVQESFFETAEDALKNTLKFASKLKTGLDPILGVLKLVTNFLAFKSVSLLRSWFPSSLNFNLPLNSIYIWAADSSPPS
jgi:hypothetical protein